YLLGLLYSVAGRNLLVVRIAQAVIGSLACVLLALAGERWFSRRAGPIAGFIPSLYAPAVFFGGVLPETALDWVLLCLLLYLLSKAGTADRFHFFSVGLSLGLLALTRENAIVLAVVVFVWTLVSLQSLRPLRFRLWQSVMVAVGMAVVLVPVAARNAYVGGGFYVTTSQFGPNFYMGNNAHTDGTASSLRAGRGSAEYERKDATQLAEQARGRRL